MTAGIRTIIRIRVSTGIQCAGWCWPPRASCRSAARRPQAADAAPRIAEAANRFLGGLDEAQRKQAMIAFESANRLDWHYIPRSRQGLALGAMTEAQRGAAQALFGSVLNERGLQAIENVRIVEGVLREQQGTFRDPDRYHVSIFGTPGRFPWAGGSRVITCRSNVALASAGHITATPFFLGSHPATVASGPHKGLRPLGAAEDLARQLMAALSEEQRRTAIIAERSFGEIVASPGRERDLAHRPACRCRRWTARRATSSRR
jgi:hypothetical protein